MKNSKLQQFWMIVFVACLQFATKTKCVNLELRSQGRVTEVRAHYPLFMTWVPQSPTWFSRITSWPWNSSSRHTVSPIIVDLQTGWPVKHGLVVFWYHVKSDLSSVPGCKKFRVFIKSFREEFQVVKRGREFKDFGEDYHVGKSVSGTNIICSIISRL